MKKHEHATGEKLKNFILGAQDGLVNVLGLVLAVASATFDTKIILISGIAGLFAESISMGAVAFTSSKAARDYYKGEIVKEKRMKLSVKDLEFAEEAYKHPVQIGIYVLIATAIGSLIPLLPFFFLPVKTGMYTAVLISAITLFIIGAVKAKLTIGDWRKSGLEMLVVGIVAALAGYFIGTLLGSLIGTKVII